MSQLSTTFATLLRRAAETCFVYFCDHCRKVTTWRLVAEDATYEFFKCESCGCEKGWKVR